LIAVVAGYFVFLATGLGQKSNGVAGFVDTWLQNALLLVGAVVATSGALRHRGGAAGRLALAAGLWTWLAGQIVWTVFYDGLAHPPVPSGADLLWFGAYTGFYACVLVTMRARRSSMRSGVWLDGAIVGLAIAALGWNLLDAPLSGIVHATQGSIALALAYPICDVVLLATIVGFHVTHRTRLDRFWLLLGAGLLLNAVANVTNVYAMAGSNFSVGGVSDGIWVAALLLLAFAARQPDGSGAPTREGERWTMAIPIGLGILAVGLVVLIVASDDLEAQIVTGAALGGIILRLLLSYRDSSLLVVARRQAVHDDLTSAANHRGLLAGVAARLGGGEQTGSLSLLLIDVHHFKELNDTLGYAAGDALLCHVADRLPAIIPEQTMIARIAGDKFAVLLETSSPERCAVAAERVHTALRTPVDLDGFAMTVSASIGAAIADAHSDPDVVLRHADVAMYEAKRLGRRLMFYTPDIDPYRPERLALAVELRAALGTGQVVPYFQPKVDIATGRTDGVEALARWEHPTRGVISPRDFLPAAERAGLTRELLQVMLEAACRQQLIWERQGLSLRVAINLSPRDLGDDDLAAWLQQAVTAGGCDPATLVFELTEETLMLDPVRGEQALHELAAIGFTLSLDDYGTGYSSLSRLKQMPVDELKIDRSFVQHMDSSPVDATIVRSTIELARNLGLRVVAEGVETAEVLDALASAGCDCAQGYHFAKPMPGAEVAGWIAANAPRPNRPLAGAGLS
jgi:diguanylate cyclase (GGDEF)-like protein